MMRLGFVEYINALPFTLAFKLHKIPFSFSPYYAVPTTLNSLLQAKKLDVALTSSVEYLDGNYQMLPGYGVAAHEKILSVNLYCRKNAPLKEIALTNQSATSIDLLKVLLHHWKEYPRLVPIDRTRPLESYDAFFLIGDEALKNLSVPDYKVIDLASAWWEMTHLPFVFAVFIIREEVAAKDILLLNGQIENALTWSEQNPEALIEHAHQQTNIAKQLLRRYIFLCKYRLRDREKEGLEKFKKLRKSLGLHVQTVSA